MILIAGLGNPGARYVGTRHNIGFDVLERFVASLNAQLAIADAQLAIAAGAEYSGGNEAEQNTSAKLAWTPMFQGQGLGFQLGQEDVLLLKPHTFMNRSGLSVQAAALEHAVEPAQVVVVHDELDLPLGALRMKLGGRDAGHRGVRSVAAELGTPDFVRLRVGIGRPSAIFNGTIADFVLEGFSETERPVVDSSISHAVSALALFISQGLSSGAEFCRGCG